MSELILIIIYGMQKIVIRRFSLIMCKLCFEIISVTLIQNTQGFHIDLH